MASVVRPIGSTEDFMGIRDLALECERIWSGIKGPGIGTVEAKRRDFRRLIGLQRRLAEIIREHNLHFGAATRSAEMEMRVISEEMTRNHILWSNAPNYGG